jgi:hypothetical protein
VPKVQELPRDRTAVGLHRVEQPKEVDRHTQIDIDGGGRPLTYRSVASPRVGERPTRVQTTGAILKDLPRDLDTHTCAFGSTHRAWGGDVPLDGGVPQHVRVSSLSGQNP